MGDTIDSCGGYQTLGARDIAIAQWWARITKASGPPKDAFRTNWTYTIDQPSSIESGINIHSLGHPTMPYQIIVSRDVLRALIAEMTEDEREFFVTNRTSAVYRMRGQVLCRLVRSGKLRVNGMCLDIDEERDQAEIK